ncbi:hypothetical protein [Streptomyces aurantiogriseus]|uniref:DUF3558 domain-containing protein n=1 Tax=Streptomyces aurantiogriseus TaxID=66870 RepID=A0A918KZK5_9ACTN|nr:hypothetical protein [Streptomyces aurantiogriseus]GGR55828.1 hypothetical protein GCM10010251_85910 [Streptomyces aurantiogriseus]
MSTPPKPSQQPEQPSEASAQPSAYPYPNPQSPGPGGTGSFPPSAPAPAPGPQNFYAQPTLAGQPGQPPVGHPYAQQSAYPSVVGPSSGGTGGGAGGAGRAVLWAAVGAVVASAAWAAGVFLIGAAGDADLRGYTAPANLCSDTDYSSFRTEYPDDDGSPTHTSLKDSALDESYCSIGLKKTGSSYADAYLSTQVDLHKKTDPGPEFTATWKNYAENHSGYDVETVEGLGDEAYLVSEDTTGGSSSGSLYATLAVRDGWMTYTMSYSVYLSSYDEDEEDPPELDDVTDWMKSDSRATLEALKG